MGSIGSTMTCAWRAVRAGAGMRRGMAGSIWLGVWVGVAAAMVVSLAGASRAQAAPGGAGHSFSVTQPMDQWPDYLETNGHTGFNSAELRINSASATDLSQHWAYAAPGPISAQPIEANGLVYVGAWDGYERALTTQ